MSQDRERFPYYIVLSRAIIRGWNLYSRSPTSKEFLSIPIDMALETTFEEVYHVDEIVRTISGVITGVTINMYGREGMLRFLEQSRDELDKRKRELASRAA